MVQQISYRAERVNELIRRELVLLLKKETKDPRLQTVVITDVIVTGDLTSAKVFFRLLSLPRKLLHLYSKMRAVFFEQAYLSL